MEFDHEKDEKRQTSTISYVYFDEAPNSNPDHKYNQLINKTTFMNEDKTSVAEGS